ncbi:hypothetical protein QR680_003564 [Steinernema hermaphroditum]|uniref:Uncharacterized protein n=1 Tax=Steinernema hermaphroditum TaxID=289476 RepID=A0AA39HLU4_9BILA|nr:hypothetical protein QR680_003564 [Steinernema hermaphroditum]
MSFERDNPIFITYNFYLDLWRSMRTREDSFNDVTKKIMDEVVRQRESKKPKRTTYFWKTLFWTFAIVGAIHVTCVAVTGTYQTFTIGKILDGAQSVSSLNISLYTRQREVLAFNLSPWRFTSIFTSTFTVALWIGLFFVVHSHFCKKTWQPTAWGVAVDFYRDHYHFMRNVDDMPAYVMRTIDEYDMFRVLPLKFLKNPGMGFVSDRIYITCANLMVHNTPEGPVLYQRPDEIMKTRL